MNAPVQASDLHRHFGDKNVLRGLTFEVREGQAFALLGRNGAGKTTALQILLGFLEPMAGRSSVLGVDSRRLAPEQRERIGYLAEGHRLFSELRLPDLIEFEAGTRTRFDRSFVERAAERLALSRTLRIKRHSRGQQAQISLLLAVAGRPDVLVFDDPAMGLDAVMRREFLGTIIELLADRGCTVLYSSHVLTDVERVADRVGILHAGRLIVDATLDDLKTRVQKRFLHVESPNGSVPPECDVPGLLRARRESGGFELTLLDLDAEREELLRAGAGRLSEARVPDLEELFFDLTVTGGAPSLSLEEVVR